MLVEWQVFITHKNYKNFSAFQFIIQHIIISCRLCPSPVSPSLSNFSALSFALFRTVGRAKYVRNFSKL